MRRYLRREVIKIFGSSIFSGTAFLTPKARSRSNLTGLWAAESVSPHPESGPSERSVPLEQPIRWPRLGKLATRPSKAIAASPLSVGFETLDRNMFDPDRTYPHLAELGVKWARVQTGWSRCEREKGRYEFGWLDAVVDRLLEIGIQPWFNLGYGNRLYTPEAKDVSAVGWAPMGSRSARQGWTQFVEALARHFARRVRHWEIWNEPNIPTFWKPQKPQAKDYVALVKLTAPILRRQVPEVVIIGGAFAGMPLQYLQECLEAGLAEEVDKISYHPYRPLPEKDYAHQVAQFRKRLDQHRPGIALWQGECGCPSATSEFATGALAHLPWTPERQAKWLLRRILSDLAEDVELASYFHTVDLLHYNWGEGKSSLHNYKGLLQGTDYTPKPSYFAYQTLCSLLEGETQRDRSCQIRVEVPGGSEKIGTDIHVIAFRRKGCLLVAYWAAADLFQPWPPRTVNLHIPASTNPKLTAPVLIHPVLQEVYQLPQPTPQNDSLCLAPLPLADFPWIITDQQALPGLKNF